MSCIVTTPTSAGELVVRVRDNGLGVPVAARARLFEQFFRAHGDTVTGVEGTGLGLSIVRETVASLGGRAWAEFPDEGGSVFGFSLPSRRQEDAAAAGTHRDRGRARYSVTRYECVENRRSIIISGIEPTQALDVVFSYSAVRVRRGWAAVWPNINAERTGRTGTATR